ncbi:MAG TPA: hypothetical protein VGG64_26140 [Pirellulales bacterium]|jgi:hypothetical protein
MTADLLQARIGTLQRRMIALAIVGFGVLALAATSRWDDCFHAYLTAYLFWLNISLGLTGLLMLLHVTGGAWGTTIRGVLEAGVRTLPLVGVLFVPIAFGLPSLYSWARPELVAHSDMLAAKQLYLNPDFFCGRAIVYFLAWILVGWLLNRWSRAQQQTPSERITRRLQRLSAVGLLVFGLTITFAAIDWGMSLEPDWYSTIYGLLFISSEFVTGMAFAILISAWLARMASLSDVITSDRLQDLASLLLSFLIIWAYMSFSQLIVIYAGDLPEEISWYRRRISGGWQWIAIAQGVFDFAVPFLALLFRDVKRNPRPLAYVAVTVFGMQLLNDVWLVEPAFGPVRGIDLGLVAAAVVGLGGVWMTEFLRQLRQRPVVLIYERSS